MSRDYGQCDDLVKKLVAGVKDGSEEQWMIVAGTLMALLAEIGRASCRERV